MVEFGSSRLPLQCIHTCRSNRLRNPCISKLDGMYLTTSQCRQWPMPNQCPNLLRRTTFRTLTSREIGTNREAEEAATDRMEVTGGTAFAKISKGSTILTRTTSSNTRRIFGNLHTRIFPHPEQAAIIAQISIISLQIVR